MARLFTSGAEIHTGINVNAAAPDGDGFGSNAPTRDTTIKYSGDASWKCDSTGSNLECYQKFLIDSADRALNRNYYTRMRMRFETLAIGAADCPIMTARGSDATPDRALVRLLSDNTLRLYNGGTGIGTATPALTAAIWYVVQVAWLFGTGSVDTLALRLYDATGATLLHSTSATGQGLSETAPVEAWWGWYGNPGANEIVYMDDFAWNDDQGANENSWPAPERKVIYLPPVSDAQVGSWTAGAGGTSNLFEAVNNSPPAGLSAAGMTNTSQITTSDTSGDNATDEYRANLRAYSAAGLSSSDTINILHPVADHGENADAGTKTGSLGLQANPSQTYATFTYGDDVAGVAIWPGNWRWKKGSPVYSPSVTLGQNPVLAIRKTDAVASGVSVDCLGLYVEYTAGSGVVRGYQRIVGPQQFATSPTDLYTVPSGFRARIRKVYVNNPTGAEIEFTLSVGTDAANTRLLDQKAVAAGESYSGRRATDHVLTAGEKIQGFSDSASTVLTIDAHLTRV